MFKNLMIIGILATIILTAGTIDLNNLDNYANQSIPAYIQKDNTPAANPITDAGATLGRVLFYDKKMSANGTTACASCHRQQFAFGDTAVQSLGLNAGVTGRHSMRLINSRFAEEFRFFWDERATSLEDQTTRPIQDHVEMGFSGTLGDPDLDSLIRKLNKVSYYPRLFEFVYGDTIITEARIQNALAQFVRSIQSFDSKYDIGRAAAPNGNAPFNNFTASENAGKALFLAPPPAGAGCDGCHRAPEFDIDSASRNNGIIGIAGGGAGTDLTNTRAPSLRDLFNPAGTLNGPLFHTGGFNNIQNVINHYNQVPQAPGNTNLDPRLQGPGANLNLTAQEKVDLEAFLRTLTGSNVYTDPKWSDPFDAGGNINVVLVSTAIKFTQSLEVTVYPNPTLNLVRVNLPSGDYQINLLTINGQVLKNLQFNGADYVDLMEYQSGTYLLEIIDLQTKQRVVKKVIKQ